ncbi:hypothetical protein SAMN04487965_3071 [Microbulbifer donghaiensis]|uniref:Lipoprotein n=1 Tax=Microbulbifer donghaiensis TaxID=494016 RepID=A0A1M5G420_9GAMM|nr:hypothetical protein [Microbulbifer donghaiensis]SHF98466.1 hypothetical protein SAMN04487965_3071 [Microbulbifer donghaiensis]
MKLTPFKKSAILLSGALALAGCEKLDGTVNGGGTMNSLGGKGKAVFTVNAQRCDEEPIKGQVNFRDETAIDWEDQGGVSFRANVTGAGLCGEGFATAAEEALMCDQRCGPGMFQVEFDYDSTNPLLPGAGKGVACMTDMSEGVNSPFGMHGLVNLISIADGPFQTYTNGGVVSGNIQTKECPSTKNDDNA